MGEQDHAGSPEWRASGRPGRLLPTGMARETSSNRLTLLLFGIPTLVIAEDPQLLAAAAAAYAHWIAEAPGADPALELRLEIGPASSLDMSFEIRVEGSRLRIAGGAVGGSADATSGLARARVPAGLAANLPALRDVTDTLLLFLLARRGRTPVHAAAFMVGRRAIVLAGPSGSGKSTLALAAAQRGHPLLSDDMVFVQRQPAFALWGLPRPIHVFPEDAPAGDHPTRQRNAKLKSALDAPAVATRAEHCVLALLERDNRLDLSPVDPAVAVEALMSLDPGFDLLESESRAAIGELASRGAWRLTLSNDPGSAIDFLLAQLPPA